MNNDTHTGWEFFPTILLGFAWVIAHLGFLGMQRDKPAPTPHWINALQCTFMFSLSVTKGFAIIAERLSQPWPDLFPLAYIGLLAAFFAPLWIWNPKKHEILSWRSALIGILYLIPFTFVAALKFKYSPDYSTTTHYWIIPVVIVSLLLLSAWIFKKEMRKQAVFGGLFTAGIVGYIAVISWVATWIT